MTKRKRETLPYDPQGYSVNLDTGTVHTRYATAHAGTTQRTRTSRGVDTLLAGRDPRVCKTCYPGDAPTAPPVQPTPEPGQARRAPNPEAFADSEAYQ